MEKKWIKLENGNAKCCSCEWEGKPLGFSNHYRIVHEKSLKLGYDKNGQKVITNRKSWGKNFKLEDILNGQYPQYQTYKLKLKLFESKIKEDKCEICGISEWQGQKLNCDLHHIDGNKNNHKLENLIILCPNCHTQTENYKSKNIKR